MQKYEAVQKLSSIEL